MEKKIEGCNYTFQIQFPFCIESLTKSSLVNYEDMTGGLNRHGTFLTGKREDNEIKQQSCQLKTQISSQSHKITNVADNEHKISYGEKLNRTKK